MKKSLLFLLFFAFWYPLQSHAATFSHDTVYQVCFTPGENCTNKIASAIYSAQKEVLVQAYSFTSRPIEKALIAAQQRGVSVRIIFDKSQKNPQFSSPRYLSRAGITLLVDEKPAIAHNKVIIIDGKEVVTGSFNFTYAAQNKNAENVLIITDPVLAKRYRQNWFLRAAQSTSYTPDHAIERDESAEWMKAIKPADVWKWVKRIDRLTASW